MAETAGNNVNNVNKVTKPNVGVIIPPDTKVSSSPYNSVEATKKFRALSRDIYQAEQTAKIDGAKSSKKGLLTTIGVVAGAVLIWKTKAIPKLINLFKKNPPKPPITP